MKMLHIKKNFSIIIKYLFFLYIIWVFSACKEEKVEKCDCCGVNTKWYRIDSSKTKLLSQFKESESYDIISEVEVKIIKSEMPIATGMDIWDNEYEYNTYFPSIPDCPSAIFAVKDIYYFRYGRLIIGYKAAQKTFINRSDNKINPGFDTSSFFLEYYNDLEYSSGIPYVMDFNEQDSLIKNKKYGDFVYKGPLKFIVYSNIGSFYPSYKHVFIIETKEKQSDRPKFIYIDKEYGLIRYVLNDGSIWSIIH